MSGGETHYFDQSSFDVRCEWGPAATRHLAPADVTVVVDVLSFSTSVEVAVGRGVTVFPYRSHDGTAAGYARERHAQLATRRDDVPRGYTLAPSSLLHAPAGLRLVLPSANGSSLAFAALSAGGTAVAAGCLRNASAVAAWAGRAGRRINVVPAGERWPDGSLRPAVEDLIGAGAVIRRLPGRPSPESRAAVAAFDMAMATGLLETLRRCASGRELIDAGFGADVEVAAAHDVSGTVPVLRGDAFGPAAD